MEKKNVEKIQEVEIVCHCTSLLNAKNNFLNTYKKDKKHKVIGSIATALIAGVGFILSAVIKEPIGYFASGLILLSEIVPMCEISEINKTCEKLSTEIIDLSSHIESCHGEMDVENITKKGICGCYPSIDKE